MPWPETAPLYNFNEFSIMLNAKPQFGVYAVFNADHKPLLIDAGEIMIDLLRLCEGADQEFRRAGPAYFSFILMPSEESLRLKRQLMDELMAPRAEPSRGAAD